MVVPTQTVGVKAIQTRYKGYHFRSRLEARWAVFFDALGLKWEYEPEGFELPGGVRYLPDFLLHDGIADARFTRHTYVEVKPVGGDVSKAIAFAAASGHEVVICDGVPDMRIYTAYMAGGRTDGAFQPVHSKYAPIYWNVDCGGTGRLPAWMPLREIEAAVVAARGARFEHGQSGATL